jgi:predicted nuclease of predicted toxin-antitoxin system
MARKRVFLDECLGRDELGNLFGSKAHVYTVSDLGVTGKEDVRVIDSAVAKKCLIVTVNKDFLGYYRKHHRRREGFFFYGLIFLRPSKILTRSEQLRRAIRETAWEETRDYDDLVTVYGDGTTSHERLCHAECAKEFAERLEKQIR